MKKEFNLDTEIICGYEVSSKMKRIWQRELEIYAEIKKVCDKHNLKIFASAGTLLGAVRHQGFIPWDDDMDFWMLQEDYEKFLKYAQDEMPENFFVQYYKTEKGYNRGHAQVRNSNTTAILKNEENTFNKGIFVDIFPLYNLPDDPKERRKFLNKVKSLKKVVNVKINQDDNFFKKILKKIVLLNSTKNIEKFENYLHKYDNVKTKECGSVGFLLDESLKREWFDNVIDLPFENTTVNSVKEYDELLTLRYGDYMQIPENKNGSLHGEIFFDTEKSYLEYENKSNK